MKYLHTPFFCFLLSFLFHGCTSKEKNPQPNEEEELITTVRLHLTPPVGPMVMATWKDLTPNDEAGRSIDTLYLANASLYSGSVELLDETKNPATDISSEVKAEANDHLFVYKPVSPLTAAYFEVKRTDHDANHRETGLKFTLETKLTGNGGLRVILRHQPGVKNGTETPGDSDVDVTFPVKIL